MDVLVVGGGGREHVLVWALKRSPSVDKLYCAPGNAGIARDATCWDIKPGDLQALAHTADEHAVDLVVVGPEAPLASGIAEVLDSIGSPCFGPGQSAAIIEGTATLREVTAADVMMPRSLVVFLSGQESLEENLRRVRDSGSTALGRPARAR